MRIFEQTQPIQDRLSSPVKSHPSQFLTNKFHYQREKYLGDVSTGVLEEKYIAHVTLMWTRGHHAI